MSSNLDAGTRTVGVCPHYMLYPEKWSTSLTIDQEKGVLMYFLNIFVAVMGCGGICFFWEPRNSPRLGMTSKSRCRRTKSANEPNLSAPCKRMWDTRRIHLWRHDRWRSNRGRALYRVSYRIGYAVGEYIQVRMATIFLILGCEAKCWRKFRTGSRFPLFSIKGYFVAGWI